MLYRISLTLVFFFIVYIQSNAQADLNKGLVAYYPFNGNANDASGNGNNPVFNNATLTADRLGKSNGAYYFNGVDNYIQIPNSNSINLSNAISLCAWVKPMGFYQGNCHGNSIIMKGDQDYLQGNYVLRFDDNQYTNGANCTNSQVDSLHQNFYSSFWNKQGGYLPYVQKGEWYSIVTTYDGVWGKMYVNCNLIDSFYTPGLSFSNGYDLFLGKLNDYLFPYWFNGVMDEIRIYNRAISQDEVNLYGGCSIVGTTQNVRADFELPDSVCVNTQVTLKNKTTGGTNFYWNFGLADINSTPDGINLGDIGSTFHLPVFTDQVFYNGNYYVFVVNNYPGGLVRLDFGNSLLNTPTAIDLGNINGTIPNNAEGIQVVQNEGGWYAIIVGGDPNSGVPSRVVKIDFGSDVTNTAPTGTSWGNIGSLAYPTDLHVFEENGNWYGFTVNSENNTITRFNFGNSFNNAPTATNLGDLGSLDFPTGIYAINDNGNWHVFITNGSDNSSISRLDFGSSLLNTPTAVNLGNIDNTLSRPRDLYLIKFCGELVGFVVNGLTNDLVKLDFHNDLSSNPTAISLGNIGNLSFPHSLSKLFQEGSDLYSFITNVNNNSITRIKFTGSNNVNIPNSSDSIPAPITYNASGIYNVNLLVDEGLPTQTSICKSITVVPSPQKQPLFDTGYCTGDSVLLSINFPASSYQWNTGATDTAISVHAAGYYWVESNYYGCTVRDSFNVSQNISPVVNLGKDTSLCFADSLLLNAGNTGATYKWQDGSTKQTYNSKSTGKYSVQVTNSSGCVGKDTIAVTVTPQIMLSTTNNTTICFGDSIKLTTTNTNIKTFDWSPANTLSDSAIYDPVAKPSDTTLYRVSVTDNIGCKSRDSVTIAVAPLPFVTTIADSAVCYGSSIILQTNATANVNYSWSPSSDLSNANTQSPIASPVNATQYIITVKTTAGCTAKDSVQIAIKPLPVISISADTLICTGFSTNLFANAADALSYSWTPTMGLNNNNIPSPNATPAVSTDYHVQVMASNGCSATDSVMVSVKQKPIFSIDPPNAAICTGQSAVFTASGGDTYQWYPTENINNPLSNVVTVSPITNTQYTAIITDNICFVTDTLYANVTVGQLSQYSLSKSNDIDCIIGESKLTATGGIQYEWSPGESLSDSTIANPVATPTETTTYHIKITNADGCVAQDTMQVKVIIGAVENGYKLPGAFTPNNDMVNDCFGVREWGALSNLDFSVYNRWGNLIFHTNNPSDCWDGTYKGVAQPTGAYVYQIRAHAICGTVYRKGTIVLIR